MSKPLERYQKLGLKESLPRIHRYPLACKELSLILRGAYKKIPKNLQSLIFQDTLTAFRLLPEYALSRISDFINSFFLFWYFWKKETFFDIWVASVIRILRHFVFKMETSQPKFGWKLNILLILIRWELRSYLNYLNSVIMQIVMRMVMKLCLIWMNKIVNFGLSGMKRTFELVIVLSCLLFWIKFKFS